MYNEILILGGYGHFVWPAFIFTLFSCLALYLKTKKELNKLEKIYMKEFKEIQSVYHKPIKRKKIAEQAVSGHSI